MNVFIFIRYTLKSVKVRININQDVTPVTYHHYTWLYFFLNIMLSIFNCTFIFIQLGYFWCINIPFVPEISIAWAFRTLPNSPSPITCSKISLLLGNSHLGSKSCKIIFRKLVTILQICNNNYCSVLQY